MQRTHTDATAEALPGPVLRTHLGSDLAGAFNEAMDFVAPWSSTEMTVATSPSPPKRTGAARQNRS